MTTTFTTDTSAVATTTTTSNMVVRPLWKAALGAGAAAASATTLVAAVASAAGVSFESAPGEAIPLLGFAQLTLIASAFGLLIARLARRAAHPRSMFVRTTAALTALSVVPDFTVPFDTASRVALVITHVVAAVIVIPVLARRLPTTR